MAAVIKLPDGVYAILEGGAWYSPDRKAIPMLEYFTDRTTGDVYSHPDAMIAQQVAAMIVGATFIRADPLPPLKPDEMA